MGTPRGFLFSVCQKNFWTPEVPPSPPPNGRGWSVGPDPFPPVLKMPLPIWPQTRNSWNRIVQFFPSSPHVNIPQIPILDYSLAFWNESKIRHSSHKQNQKLLHIQPLFKAFIRRKRFSCCGLLSFALGNFLQFFFVGYPKPAIKNKNKQTNVFLVCVFFLRKPQKRKSIILTRKWLEMAELEGP